jgi:hypothetical protein
VVASAVGVPAAAFALLVASATPAAAHGTGGLKPTNYETRILRIEPDVPGLDLDVVDLGDRLQLTNTGDRDVVVLGYEGEPYLRVGPQGVFENVRSPAHFLNRTRLNPPPVPPSASSDAAPRWRKTSGGTSVAWHDHRAHWMSASSPPAVQRDPGRRHLVQEFELTLRAADRTVTVRGDVIWVPAPAVWPMLVVALALALLVVALGRTRIWPWVLAVGLVALAASEVVHLVGAWPASTDPGTTKALGSLFIVAACIIACVPLVVLLFHRDDPYAMTPAALLGAIAVLLTGGLAEVQNLLRSQLPTVLAPALARLQVVLALGLGLGIAITAVLRLQRPRPRRRPHRREPVPAVER